MKKKVLFVDDEENILDGLKRLFRPMREEWDMYFLPGGEEALELMAQEPMDIIVTDMRMPKMDGLQLLTTVKEKYPETIRFILSGHSDRELLIKSASLAHQYLSKPCDAEVLRATVNHAFQLRQMLNNDKLKGIIAHLKRAPVMPALYQELVKELESPDSSMKSVSAIIERDVGMTMKILQMVNSAYFGLKRKIVLAEEAVNFLGLEIVKALVLTIEVFDQFQNADCEGFSSEKLFAHSMICANKARDLAKELKMDRTAINNAFMTGILHDVGKLLLAANMPEEYAKVFVIMEARGLTAWEAEWVVFGVTHTEVAAYLLGLWGFPDEIVEAVAYHHTPLSSLLREVSTLALVHVVDALYHETEDDGGMGVKLLNVKYLSEIKFAGNLEFARKIVAGSEERE